MLNQPPQQPKDIDAKLADIIAQIEQLIGGQPEPPWPSDADLAAIRTFCRAFYRMSLGQQLHWLRRFAYLTRSLHAERSQEAARSGLTEGN